MGGSGEGRKGFSQGRVAGRGRRKRTRKSSKSRGKRGTRRRRSKGLNGDAMKRGGGRRGNVGIRLGDGSEGYRRGGGGASGVVEGWGGEKGVVALREDHWGGEGGRRGGDGGGGGHGRRRGEGRGRRGEGRNGRDGRRGGADTNVARRIKIESLVSRLFGKMLSGSFGRSERRDIVSSRIPNQLFKRGENGRPPRSIGLNHRRGSLFLATTLVPLFDLFVGHSEVVGNKLLVVGSGVVGVMSKQPFKSTNLLRVVDSLSFVGSTNFAIAKPSTDLLGGKTSLTREMGDILFLFGSAIADLASNVITLQSFTLFLRKVNSRFALFSS